MASGGVRRQQGSALAPRDRMSMRRIVIKQSYLSKLPNSARVGSSFKSPHRRWFVFGVMNGKDPYLEYYETQDSVFMGSPINMFLLDTCKRVKKRSHIRYQNVFSIVLKDRDVTLFADTRTLMEEWCSAISRKLMSIGVFVDVRRTKEDDDHIYVLNPVSRPLTRNERDRFYPNRPAHPISCDRSKPLESTTPDNQDESYKQEDTSPTLAQGAYEEPRAAHPENSYTVPSEERNSALTNGDIAIQESPMDTPPQTPPSSDYANHSHWIMFGNTEAQPITMATPPVSPATPVSPTDSIYMNFPSLRPLSGDLSPPIVSDQEPVLSLMTPKVLEASGAGPVEDAVVGWNMPPPDVDAPPLYLPQAALERGANRSLKMSQVEQVRKEKENPGGVRVQLRKIDCLYAIAIVDCFDSVWIAGWNQHARPRLHNAFHIGDQLISVNGQVVESAKIALKLIKSCKEDDKICFVLTRLPYARILAIKRREDGDNLGIKMQDGTAEIVRVDEMGAASEAGLSQRALDSTGNDFCNWWITEINHRPLNLFFKDDEISRRLNAVGKDISIMIQPSHFINELKRKLKAYRNYKDFLLQ